MSSKSGGIDKELIRELANILNDTDLTEIEVEQDALRIRVCRQVSVQHVAVAAPAPAPAHHLAASPAPQSASASAQAHDAGASGNGAPIPSPMVGTAYLAPAPGAAPFIQVGQSIREGQTILIIEAMKTMNQIPAPRSGKVAAILIDDGQPVEYGQPLITLE